ncbi:MAG: LysR family transcriptional regulator [Cyanobacteria bacterium P01_A01_bin.123]
MNLGKLKLSQLRALVAIAECGNFSSAALQLDVTQSTISHAIATLEDELGVVLLTRGRHGAHLTPVGARVTTKAVQILDLLEGMAKDAQQAKGLQGGTVRIAAFRSVATNLLPSAIARLHSRYPNVNVTITELDELQQFKQVLLQGQADICVTELLDGDEFDRLLILEDEYIALLPPQVGLRDAQLHLEDLEAHPLISSSHNSCFARIERQINKLQEQQHPIEIAYRIRHDSSMVSMVSQGLGIAILPKLAASPVPSNVQVCRLPFKLSRPIGASLLKEGLHTPAVYAFLDALRETGEFSVQQAV